MVASAPRAAQKRNTSWAELMRVSFGLDVLACPDCGGRMRHVATLHASAALNRILRAHGYVCAALPIQPARAPPEEIHDWL